MSGRRLAARWREVRWAVIAVAVVVTLVLGFVGYGGAATTDRVFASVRLVSGTFDAGLAPPPRPWEIEVARFLGLAISLTVLAIAVSAVLARRIEEARARSRRGHVVVCGLGDTGRCLALALAARGERPVAVERDASATAIASCRDGGVLVVTGDARDPAVLARAGVRRARGVAALTGDDAANVAVATAAARVGERLATAVVALEDPEVAELVRRPGLALDGVPLELVSIHARAARALVRRLPEAPGAPVALVGSGRLLRALLLELAHRRALAVRDDPAAPRTPVMVVGPDAAAVLAAALPVVRGHLDAEVAGSAEEAAAALAGRPARGAIVCLRDEADGVRAAAALARALEASGAPVLVRAREAGAGLAALGAARLPGRVETFAVADAADVPRLVDDTTAVALARAVHEAYRAGRPDVPAWEGLDAERRAASLRHAAELEDVLAAAFLRVVPAAAAPAAPAVLAPDEVEALAGAEHERWRRHAGPGAPAWADASAADREATLRIVHAWPLALDEAGLVLERDPLGDVVRAALVRALGPDAGPGAAVALPAASVANGVRLVPGGTADAAPLAAALGVDAGALGAALAGAGVGVAPG